MCVCVILCVSLKKGIAPLYGHWIWGNVMRCDEWIWLASGFGVRFSTKPIVQVNMNGAITANGKATRPSAGCFCQEMSMALHVSIWDGVVSKRDTTKKTETLVIICKKRLTHIHIHIPSYTNIILIPFLFIIHNLWPFILQPLRNPEATDREIGFVMEAGSNPSRSLSVIDSTGITMIFQETNFITAMDTMIYIYIYT